MKTRFLLWFRRQPLFVKVLCGIGSAVFIVGAGFAFLFMLVVGGTFRNITYADIKKIENPLASEIYSADSVLLGRYYIQERSDIRFEEIPTHVVDALIATEDVRFFDHSGIDYRSYARVLIKSIFMRDEASGGGSTLTQQLAKNLFPRKNYWMGSLLINKMQEMVVAHRLENLYDKNALITLYLNTVSFGDNTYGIESAAQRFFSKPAQQLSLDEGAVLVGMLKATYTYNPRIFPDRATGRRNVVLDQMEKNGKLSAAQADSVKSIPIKLSYSKITHHTGLAPYFREQLRQELLDWCRTHTDSEGNQFDLYSDGLKIYTTIDSKLQRYAEAATTKQMKLLQKQFLDHWGKRDPWYEQPTVLQEALRKSNRYKQLKAAGKSEEEIMAEMKKPHTMTVFSWEGDKETEMSSLDSIRYYLKFLQAGLLAMSPRTGAIRAWVGGINHEYFQYDHVRESTKRQVGSIFKPIVYAAALEAGEKPCTFISAEKTTFTDSTDTWSPRNTDDGKYGLKYSMEGGLAFSVNTVAVHVLEKAGIDSTIALAKRMGVNTPLPAVPSLALGTPSLSVMEMVTAYACIANNGKTVKPHYLTSITTHDGNVIEQFEPEEGKQVLQEEHAAMLVHMMQRVVDEGTGARLRTRYNITNDVAGKTGTTQSNADGWFMAITPELVTGSWVGADDPRIRFRTTALGQGANTALPIVGYLFQNINRDPALTAISKATFPELPFALKQKLNCELYKNDITFMERIFGRNKRDTVRTFGEPKKSKRGFLKRLLGID